MSVKFLALNILWVAAVGAYLGFLFFRAPGCPYDYTTTLSGGLVLAMVMNVGGHGLLYWLDR